MTYTRIDGQLLLGEWKEVTQERRTGKFLFFFPTEWWETVKLETISKEIHATVDPSDKVEAVYVNGEKFIRELVV